jgi:hypothetical protein|tara:strand:- start:11140 stop:11472 length:333 start_codon:yes stop_codon:yes gene_type:complete
MKLTSFLDGLAFTPERAHINGFYFFKPSETLLEDYSKLQDNEWEEFLVGFIYWVDITGIEHKFAKVIKHADDSLSLNIYVLGKLVIVQIDQTMIDEFRKTDKKEVIFLYN